MIPYELDSTSTPLSDTKILTYQIELPSPVKKVCFILLNDEYSKIPYITDIIPNSSSSHQLPAQAKQNVCIVDFNVEEPFTTQGDFDELNRHQTPRGKSKVNISIRRWKSYQRTDFEDIRSRSDQVRPVVSNL